MSVGFEPSMLIIFSTLYMLRRPLPLWATRLGCRLLANARFYQARQQPLWILKWHSPRINLFLEYQLQLFPITVRWWNPFLCTCWRTQWGIFSLVIFFWFVIFGGKSKVMMYVVFGRILLAEVTKKMPMQIYGH